MKKGSGSRQLDLSVLEERIFRIGCSARRAGMVEGPWIHHAGTQDIKAAREELDASILLTHVAKAGKRAQGACCTLAAQTSVFVLFRG
jgi:hypothetical protein